MDERIYALLHRAALSGVAITIFVDIDTRNLYGVPA